VHTKAPIDAIAIRATAATIARYKGLLSGEWTKSLPHDVLDLLWSSVTGRPTTGHFAPLFRLLDPSATIFPGDYFHSIVDRITEGTKFIRRAELPEMDAAYRPTQKPVAAVWQANRLVTWLTLPAHVKVTGDTTFFANVQSLAFQAALHVTLPALAEKHPADHALLLHACVLFSLGQSACDPAHDAYMMAQIYGYLGEEERRLRSLYAAFRFTAPQDHSYLTKAQEFWTELLDANRNDEAEQFLFSLHWWCLPNQQEEVRAMIADAYKHILSLNHRN
jgi:hypothetical protein